MDVLMGEKERITVNARITGRPPDVCVCCVTVVSMAVTKEIWVNVNKLAAIGSKILTLSYIASKSLDEMLNESCVLFFAPSELFKVSLR